MFTVKWLTKCLRKFLPVPGSPYSLFSVYKLWAQFIRKLREELNTVRPRGHVGGLVSRKLNG